MKGELPLTPEDVADIIAILEKSPYERIEIRTRRLALSVARSGEDWVQSWEWPQESKGALTAMVPAADPGVPGSSEPAEENDGLIAIRAPLPGTFYRAPQPGAPPFVEVGSSVGPDSVVAIIETMKLMSPVHAGVRGRVAAILIDNGTAVEANAIVIRVEPARP